MIVVVATLELATGRCQLELMLEGHSLEAEQRRRRVEETVASLTQKLDLERYEVLVSLVRSLADFRASDGRIEELIGAGEQT